MDPDEIADAVAARQEPVDNSTNYDGRVAVNSRTGERLVYRISPGGRGRFVALSADTAAPAARDRVGELTTRSQIGHRTLGLARKFIDLNATAATGGFSSMFDSVFGGGSGSQGFGVGSSGISNMSGMQNNFMDASNNNAQGWYGFQTRRNG